MGLRRRVAAAIVMVGMVAGLSASPATALPPPPAREFRGLLGVDASGRHVLLRGLGGNGDVFRLDRLTGATVDVPGFLIASGDLRQAITVDAGAPSWRDVASGTSTPVPFAAAPGRYVAPVELSADGQLLLVGQAPNPPVAGFPAGTDQSGAWVVSRTGEVQSAPEPDVSPVDMSANGRWVLLFRNEGVTFGGPLRYFRWDRATGAVSLYATTSNFARIALAIGDNGQVLETEYLTGNSFNGGVARTVVRDGARVVEIEPAGLAGSSRMSADGSLALDSNGTSEVAFVDIPSGVRTVDSSLYLDPAAGIAVGPTGGIVAAVKPGSNPAQTPGTFSTLDLVALSVPGRAGLPRVAGGETVIVPVAGVRGVPADASAAVLNLTVTNPAGPGFVTVWPCDQTRPDASNVNVTGVGRTVANAVVSKLSATGSACVYASTDVDLIVDVQGHFTGAAYTGIAPDRFADTRNGETDSVGNVAAGQVVTVAAAGARGVPVGASAVVLNVTVTNPAGAGFVTVWPCDQARPDASNVNVTGGGQTVANAVVSKVAADGSVCLYTSTGADLIVDVQGFFAGAAYEGLTPDRFVDTRNGETDSVGNVAAGGTVTVPVAGVRGVPAGSSAVVLNVTVTNPAGPGFVTVWPCDQTRPDASNVNFTGAGATVANAVIAKLALAGSSAGSVCVYSSTGADLIVDVQGSFTDAAYTGVTPDRFLDTRG